MQTVENLFPPRIPLPAIFGERPYSFFFDVHCLGSLWFLSHWAIQEILTQGVKKIIGLGPRVGLAFELGL